VSRIKLALEVVENMRSLASSFEYLVQAMEGNEPAIEPNEKAHPVKAEGKSKSPEVPVTEAAPKETIPTLEEVRALMAAKNREGHREAVKAILNKFGAQKLTALDPSYYKKVMQEVGDLK
jgi:hypothetical protein